MNRSNNIIHSHAKAVLKTMPKRMFQSSYPVHTDKLGPNLIKSKGMLIIKWLIYLFKPGPGLKEKDLDHYRPKFEEITLKSAPSTNLEMIGDKYIDPSVQQAWREYAESRFEDDWAW